MKIEIKRKLILEDEEAEIFLNAMKYIRHRLKFHPDSKGAKTVCELEMAEFLLRQLEGLRHNN